MRKILPWAAVILWMALIFFFSAQVAEQSDQLSTGITEKIITIIKNVIPDAGLIVETMNHVVRKYAHFFVYLMLGVLTANALRSSGMRGLKGLALAFAICVLYAASDEVHQLFVPGRSCQLTDVLIDSTGALIGSGIVGILSGKRHPGSKNKA